MNISQDDVDLLDELAKELLEQAESILESNTFPMNDESTLDEESREWWLGVRLQAARVAFLRTKLSNQLYFAAQDGASP